MDWPRLLLLVALWLLDAGKLALPLLSAVVLFYVERGLLSWQWFAVIVAVSLCALAGLNALRAYARDTLNQAVYLAPDAAGSLLYDSLSPSEKEWVRQQSGDNAEVCWGEIVAAAEENCLPLFARWGRLTKVEPLTDPKHFHDDVFSAVFDDASVNEPIERYVRRSDISKARNWLREALKTGPKK
ncbi:hypothetical protein FLX56_11125 [Synechococcus moorigangaii CMS01]|nr:hypothetical protein [Synechococcus moorigangaii CMS01]